MTLRELIQRVPAGLLRPVGPSEALDRPITDIAYDSRRVTPESVFVAMRGEKADGHDFLPDAAAAGAAAVVGEDEGALSACGAMAFVTVNARRAIAELASALYGNPSSEMDVIGVTGTNGKTTTVHLIERLYARLGFTTGRIGTLGVMIGDEEEEGAHTTPEAPDLQKTLRRMADAGVQKVAMEVSSHALAQDRTWGTHFSAIVFTNLTQDHLDYHKDMEDYFAAKCRLFAEYDPARTTAVINVDDPYGQRLAKEIGAWPSGLLKDGVRPMRTYGVENGEDRATDITPVPGGTEFTLQCAGYWSLPIRLRLPGMFNVYNALAAFTVVSTDVFRPGECDSPTPLVDALQTLTGAPGRFESVDRGQDFAVLVDYAHTPDALENVLRAAREITPNGRVLAVFGCGGDRDKTKRPKMGRIGVTLADFAFVTSDNPRTEEPEAIIADIVASLHGCENYAVDPDRRAAIFTALAAARPGDTVVIAGKGHEDYQIIGTTKYHFDDREIAAEALETRRSMQ